MKHGFSACSRFRSRLSRRRTLDTSSADDFAHRPILPVQLTRSRRVRGVVYRIFTAFVFCAVVVGTVAFSDTLPQATAFLDNAIYALVGSDRQGTQDPGGTALPLPTADPTETPAAPSATVAVTPEVSATPTPSPTVEATASTAGEKAPVLGGAIQDGRILLVWTAVQKEGLKGFEVVASQYEDAPQYPDNGSFEWITDTSCTTASIDIQMEYTAGDFGSRMIAGQSYWFAITAVYEDGSATSNSVRLVCPEDSSSRAAFAAPTVAATSAGGIVTIQWTPIADERLVGYAVVASRDNPNPAYPGQGYLLWITDPQLDSATVSSGDSYNGGDFGSAFVSGTDYWFSVTAIYDIGGEWVKVPGNAILLTFPDVPAN